MTNKYSVEQLIKNEIKKRGAICFGLIDSEGLTEQEAAKMAKEADKAGVAAILVGGSTAMDQLELDKVVRAIKKAVAKPVIIFPSNVNSVVPSADAILFSSLLNSENTYFITEAQALGALLVKKYGLEAIPMAYLIVGEGGAAGFIGKARGIPNSKPEIAAMYALASQYLGMRFLYLEAGSGVISHVSSQIVQAVRKVYDGVLIVGGGITKPEIAEELVKCGADILVIGTLLESKDGRKLLSKIVNAAESAKAL
ncbi:MAG: geranylgeranylglyceryl/heptaprenylglyceryl phosphate synthase [Nitrososphaerales archaeon]